MIKDAIYLLQDIGEYARAIYQWKSLRRVGKGIDYTSDKYRQSVQRAVERLHPERMKLRVAEIITETPTTKTFRFSRTDGALPPFRAGQYVNLFVEIDGVKTSRPYSISSLPNSDFLDLTVRAKPNGFVSLYLLSKVKVGDEFISTGPQGTFYYEPLIDGKNLVFLAGGSGITPFMSIIRQASASNWPFKITLIYGSRVLDDVIFGDELDELSRGGNKFKYALVISEPPQDYSGLKGFLTAELIKEIVGDVKNKTFYICGPNVMYDFCLAELEKLKVPSYKIKRELYGPPDDVTKERGWPKDLNPETVFSVEVVGYKKIEAKAGEPLMNSLERNGIIVEASCRSGACSLCRTKLLSGRVFMPEHTAVRESDRANNYIHLCVSYPLENLKIKI